MSLGLCVGGRFKWLELVPYVIFKVLGAILGAFVYLIASGKAGFDLSAGFAANGYGEHSPGGYSLKAAVIAEVVLTFMFLLIILGATDRRAPPGFAPIAIGLGLTLSTGPIPFRRQRRDRPVSFRRVTQAIQSLRSGVSAM